MEVCYSTFFGNIYLNFNSWGYLKKTSNGYTIPIAKFGPNDAERFTWVAHDLGAATVALLTHYSDPSKGVLGKSYPVVSFRSTYSQLAAAIAKGVFYPGFFCLHVALRQTDGRFPEIGREVTFTTLETQGLREFDDMVSAN